MFAAGDEQHHHHRAERDVDRRAETVADERLIERLDGHAPGFLERRLELRQTRAHGAHLLLGLFQADTGLEAADRAEPMVGAGTLLGCEHERLPEAGVLSLEDAGRKDSDDLVRLSVEHDVTIEDGAIPAEVRLPCRVTQHDDRRRARLIFLWREGASDERLHAEDREVVGRHEHPAQPRRFAVAGQRDVEPARCRQRLERRAQPLPVDEIEGRNPVA